MDTSVEAEAVPNILPEDLATCIRVLTSLEANPKLLQDKEQK
jgi:hypothetical protein